MRSAPSGTERRTPPESPPDTAPLALAELFGAGAAEVGHAPSERGRRLRASSLARARAAIDPRPASRDWLVRRGPRWLQALVPRAVVLGFLCWGLLFNFSEVRGSSMEPGIHDADRILVDHFSYLFSPVERGDVVILRYPLDPSLDYVKRVVGLPGDEIVIESGELRVNGVLLEEPYLCGAAVDPYTRMRAIVEDEHYFVLGDNRMRSSDSREFGQVPHDYLRGKVQARVWPPNRLGWIQ